MIAITLSDGSLLRMLGDSEEGIFGFHRLFGFLEAKHLAARLLRRKRSGLSTAQEGWSFQFQVIPAAHGFKVKGIEGCDVSAIGNGKWELQTEIGKFFIADESVASASLNSARFAESESSSPESSKKVWAALLVLFFLGYWFLSRTPEVTVVEPEIVPEVLTVKVVPKTKPVVVPMTAFQVPEALNPLAKAKKDSGAAVKQNLGFLGLLGKKDLTKAIGGMPTSIDSSPGAGPGGKEGSGGELLVGLGKGVRRTTVGNTGVAGLGGLGNGKGPGGGGGGYGNSWVGSGSGKAISAIPVSQDLVLEGGLDKAVIQATIAKYLSQVRACYEEGLGRNSGLLGQVTMNFEINGTGRLNFSKVGKSTLGDVPVENCISNRMMGWEFPKPVGGVAVKVSYPFLLRPVNS